LKLPTSEEGSDYYWKVKRKYKAGVSKQEAEADD